MTDSKVQVSSEQASFEEFKEKLLADLPALERLAYTIREFCSQKSSPAAPKPCDECPVHIKEKCNNPCEALEAFLPRPYAGKFHGEGTTSLNLDETRDDHDLSNDLEEEDMKKLDHSALKSLQKVSSPDLFRQYKVCWDIFTHKQREVLTKFYKEGKNKTQIAKELHKAISTIHNLLKRAEQRKQDYYEKKRS